MANYRIAIEEYLPIQKAVEAIYDNPPSHSDGLRVLVGTTPTGVFTGHTNDIAWSNEGAWFFDTPVSGWRVWVNSLDYELIYIDTEWVQSNTHITDGEYDDSAFLTGVTNLGSGIGVYNSLSGRTIQLRSIVGSGDTTVSLSGETILVHTDVPATTYGTLNSTCTTALSTSASESFGSNICLHRVSKTGCYDHLSGTPTIPTVNDGQLSISGGTLISGGGIFTANQSTPTSVTLNHETLTTTTGTTAQTATHGGTITMIDAVTGNSGHITGVRNKTVTLPAAYSHPTGFNNQPGTALTTACVISQIGVTSEGHVSGVTSRNLTTTDIGAVPTTTFNCYTGTSQPILDCAVTGATNIGTGSQIYSSKSGRNLQLRSIVGSGDTTVTTVGNDIIVHTTIPADANTYTTGVTVTGTTTKCLTLTLNNGSTVSTSFTDLDTDTITRLRGGTSGTYCSGDITICGGGDVTVGQSTSNITLTYSHPTGGVMQPSTPLTNACVISQIGVNSLGHVTGHTSRNLTAGDLGALTAVNLGPATATTYFEITNSAGTNACISGATSTYAGLVTTGNQLWAGTKCFPTFSGGTVCGATLVCGGTVRGTTICGTTISGTTVCGNTISGGTISGVSTISTCLRVTSGATTGYVLTSDASGNATWQAVPENDAVKKEITQASHGFSVGDVVGYSGTTYNKAIADGNYDGEILGIVSKVVSTSIFELTQSGYVTGLTSLSQGSTYFLSPTTAGAITATEPTTNGQVSKAVLLANSTTTGWVLPYPGYLVSTGQTGALTGVTNLGDGIGVYDSTSANVARFRSILGSGDTTVTLSGGTIIVYTDAPDGSLSGLSDTTISSPIGGDLLYYSGDTWVNYTPDAFLNNICTSAPLCAGQILVYDSLNGYWCNTNGENCFIIHGSIEETGTTINGTGALSGTGTITYITSVGGTNPTTITISHLDTAGYKHIPSGGSTGQILCYGGSSGTATWGDAPSAVVNLGVTTAATTNTITNDSGGSNAILSGATSTAAGLVTNANQTWAGIKCTSTFCGTTSLLSPLVSGTTVCGVNASGFTNVIGTNICGTTLVSGVTTCGTNIRGGNISGTTISGATHIRSADISGGTVCGNTAVCSATLVCGGTIRGTTICGGTVSATTLTALTSMCSSSISGTTISGGTVCGATLRGATTCVGTIRISGGTPGAGKFLCSDASGNATWVNLPTASLSGLSDTTITSPSSGQVLSWNGSAWINCTSPAGVTTFTGLTDTPNGYTANTYVRVNSTGSALEYRSASNVLSDISAASSVHIHGNILNDGTIKGAVITPESGDTILLSDAN
ncbi:MAG: DUF2793 domain-containing protein, partial [Bacteroidales bacterium]|nr:DUF2793 domain-containing protein [Bacteroidales bacterium]